MKITIIHPSRSRPELAKQICQEWLSKAVSPENIDYYISIDVDDPKRAEYENNPNWKCIVSINTSAIEAINNAAKWLCVNDDLTIKSGIVIVVSDDFGCPNKWDSFLNMHLHDKSDFIVKTLDGYQPWIITLPIMDWSYYSRFGYIYYPGYQHMFCDTEMTCVADMLGKKIELLNDGYVFEHRHYSLGKSAKDQINEKNDRTWDQGSELFNKRLEKDFDLDAGQIVSRAHLDRFK